MPIKKMMRTKSVKIFLICFTFKRGKSVSTTSKDGNKNEVGGLQASEWRIMYVKEIKKKTYEALMYYLRY